jgi:hypothetical protein
MVEKNLPWHYLIFFSYGLIGQQKQLGHFIKKAKRELQMSLGLQDDFGQRSQFVGHPIIDSTVWKNSVQLCSSCWQNVKNNNNNLNANVLCRSLGHYGGGQR